MHNEQWTFARLLAALTRVPVVGNVLRFFARRFPEGSVTTVRSGPGAGLRWRRWRRFINAYWAGTYELPVQQALAASLAPGATCYDLGANAGFFTLLAAKRVGPDGRVVACEPLPANAEVLRDQVAINGFDDRVRVEQVAVSDHEGEARLTLPGRGSGRLVEGGTGPASRDPADGAETLAVPLTTLDALAARHGPPDVVKLDVEGAEAAALRGAAGVLAERSPTFIIELHGAKQRERVWALLGDYGYDVFDLDGQPVAPPDLPARLLARRG